MTYSMSNVYYPHMTVLFRATRMSLSRRTQTCTDVTCRFEAIGHIKTTDTIEHYSLL